MDNSEVDTNNSDKLDIMPDGATPAGPDDVGASSGLSILALSGLQDQQPVGNSVPLGRDGLPKRKPGRPRKNPIPETPSETLPQKSTPVARRAARVSSEELARGLVNTGQGALMHLIGPEWAFESQAEADGVRMAVAAYIEAKGDGKVSPEVMLLLVLSGYAVPRTAHENTRQKIGKFFKGIYAGFRGLFSRGE